MAETEPRLLARVQVAVLEVVGVREDRVGFVRVAHVLLDAEVRHRDAEVQVGGQANGGEVGGAVAARAHVVELGQGCDLAQVRDPARVGGVHADVVDQLLCDQLLAVPDRIEDLADRDRGGGVLTDDPEGFLVLGRRRILEPEQRAVLDPLAQLARLDRRQAMVNIVQQVEVEAELLAHGVKQLGHELQVGARLPDRLQRQLALCRLVVVLLLADPVHLLQAGHQRLGAHCQVTLLEEALDRV